LEWARTYGDFDGDGFVEYRRISAASYSNQGWKDSEDAVVYPDGSIVRPPIALCEVQGYHFDSLRRMAAMAQLVGDQPAAAQYAERADALFQRFNEVFWLPDEGIYAYGLDPDKRAIDVRTSNLGHLLWSGIVPRERARLLAERLLAQEMFTGWGLRTLSAASRGYNPVSYHRGSVWPHDNAIAALGLKRYGHWQEANRVAEGIFAVAGRYKQNSLPEVFAGLDRSAGNAPVPYVEANLPQAWAAGSVFMLLQSVLGLEPDPAERRLYVAPALPEWLPELEVRGLPVFGGKVDLHFRGLGPQTETRVLSQEGDVRVEDRGAASAFFPFGALARPSGDR
jgi:glycogen debranching enzyme